VNPTDYNLELSSFDPAGRATKFAAMEASVGKGETLTFNPDWEHLDTGAGTVTIRTAQGDATNRSL
jgi:hypothetical protein